MKDNNYNFQEEIENEIPSSANDDFIEVIYLTFKGPIGNHIKVCYAKKIKYF